MIVLSGFLAIFSHLVVPVWFVASIWRGNFRSRVEWLAAGVGFGAYILFLFLAGTAWHWISYYFRVTLPVAFLCAVFVSFRRISRCNLPWWRRPGSPGDWVSLAANVLIALYFLLSVALTVGGFSYGSRRSARLSFPLQGGVYHVIHGGNHPILNYHNVNPAQRFALDIVELNPAGTRAMGFYPSDLERYTIFGQTIHSPCEGEVIEVRDGLPDLTPPEADGEHLAGNHIVVRCGEDDVDVVLAHMMEGSIAVTQGERVEAGQVIGRVGNSGNTSEPHLHIHGVRTGSGSTLDGEGVPLLFDGRFLVRNSLVFR